MRKKLFSAGELWKIPPLVAKETAWVPEDAWTNLAMMRRITALSEESLGNKSISHHQTLLKEKCG